MPPRKLTSPPTRHVAVLTDLRKRIVEGELRPGDQLFADAIAEELGVSRIPVREALRVLEGEGQVFYEPHRGYFITELTVSDLRELYLMRHLLEVEALRRCVPLLGPEHFADMEAAQADLAVAHEAGAIFDVVAANRRFHFAFLLPLDMPRLRRQIEMLYDQCDAYGAVYYTSDRNRERSKLEHVSLMDAARAGDSDQVIDVLSKHREHVVEALRTVLPEVPAADAER